MPIKRLIRFSKRKLGDEHIRETEAVTLDWSEHVLTCLLAGAPKLRFIRRGEKQRKGERVIVPDFGATAVETGVFNSHA